MAFDKSVLNLARIRYSLGSSQYDYLSVNHVAASVLIMTYIAKAPVKTLNKSVPLILLESPFFKTGLKGRLSNDKYENLGSKILIAFNYFKIEG